METTEKSKNLKNAHPRSISVFTSCAMETAEKNPVRVAVRCRPLNDREKSEGKASVVRILEEQRRVFSIHDNLGFQFDFCYGPSAGQERVNADIGDAVVENALDGYNSVVFAYGKTGSGKTHTMTGLIDHVVARLLAKSTLNEGVSNHNNGVKPSTFRLEAFYFEVYNEEIYDLWSPKGRKKITKPLYTDRRTGYLDLHSLGLAKKEIEADVERFRTIMAMGQKARAVATTKLNARSSRSHAILRLEFTKTDYVYLETQDAVKAVDTFSCHDLVDLAGSENTRLSGATGVNRAEAGKINQSLVTLQRVIECLYKLSGDQSRGNIHVPYRDSKLTHLLRPSLGGNAKAFMIATISPADHQASSSTLDYANKCSKVVNHPKINQDENEDALNSWKSEVAELSRKLQLTQAKLQNQPPSEHIQRQLEQKERRISELEEELAQTKVKEQLKGMELEEMKAKSDEMIQTCAQLERSVREEVESARKAREIAASNKENVEHFKSVNKALCSAVETLKQTISKPSGRLPSPKMSTSESLDHFAREKEFVRQVAAAHINNLEQQVRKLEQDKAAIFKIAKLHLDSTCDHLDRLESSVLRTKDRLQDDFEATDSGQMSADHLQESLAEKLTLMFVFTNGLSVAMNKDLEKLRHHLIRSCPSPVRSQHSHHSAAFSADAHDEVNVTTYFSDDEEEENDDEPERNDFFQTMNQEETKSNSSPKKSGRISHFLQSMESIAENDFKELQLEEFYCGGPKDDNGFQTPSCSPK